MLEFSRIHDANYGNFGATRRFRSCRPNFATETKARTGAGGTAKSSARSNGGTAPAARPRGRQTLQTRKEEGKGLMRQGGDNRCEGAASCICRGREVGPPVSADRDRFSYRYAGWPGPRWRIGPWPGRMLRTGCSCASGTAGWIPVAGRGSGRAGGLHRRIDAPPAGVRRVGGVWLSSARVAGSGAASMAARRSVSKARVRWAASSRPRVIWSLMMRR